MPARLIFLARHGQTRMNRVKWINGQMKHDGLDALGFKQRVGLFLLLKDQAVAAVFTSALERTHQTAAPVAAHFNLKPVVVPELNEFRGGVFQGICSAFLRGRAKSAAAASCEGALAVERRAVEALSFIADGDLLRARNEAETAVESLGKMIKEVRDRERHGLGVPSRLNQNVLQSALLDISAVLCATDRCEKAIELLSQLRGTDEWVPEYVAKETLFTQLHSDPNLRSRIEEWKAAEKAHWVSRDSKAGS